MMQNLSSIMLIDDNEADNFFHSRIIQNTGCADKVISFTEAEKALEYLNIHWENARRQPDIIFLDINMPGMNGWDFLSEYEKLSVEQQLNSMIVMLTTSENPLDEKRSKEFDVIKGFINKPLNPIKLQAILDTCF